jgi:hypothetical protein
LAGDDFALRLHRLLFVECERDFVLDGPEGANGGDIAALGGEVGWNLQGLE